MASLTMRKESTNWYGVYRDGGKRHVVNLGVKIRGNAPQTISGKGDPAFEQSRGKARKALDNYIRDLQDRNNQERMARKIYESKTGSQLKTLPLQDLPNEWTRLPHTRERKPQYVRYCQTLLRRFVDWTTKHYDVEDVMGITPEIARAYMQRLEKDGTSERTYNENLGILRSTFQKLAPEYGLPFNPFDKAVVVGKQNAPQHRRPFSADELKAILAAAEQHSFIKPILITALCTAMRRGDCATLKWADVDLNEGFVTVETSKTGERVDIPVGNMLRAEFERHKGLDDTYVFPEQAKMYQQNPDGLTYRLRKVLRDAGFADNAKYNGKQESQEKLTASHFQNVREALLPNLPDGKSGRRLLTIFDSYSANCNVNSVVKETGFGKGTVSKYLNMAENITGYSILRGKVRPQDDSRGNIRAERKNGKLRASIRDFHSFRVTWVTLALASGIPMEIVRRVTGHRTTEVVLRHYWRPEREQIRKAFTDKMPGLLTAGMTSRDDKLTDLLEAMTNDNWQDKRDAALKLLQGHGKNS